jgi:hypothetical protein
MKLQPLPALLNYMQLRVHSPIPEELWTIFRLFSVVAAAAPAVGLVFKVKGGWYSGIYPLCMCGNEVSCVTGWQDRLFTKKMSES